MASNIIEKIKETVIPSNTEGYNTNARSYNNESSDSNARSYNNESSDSNPSTYNNESSNYNTESSYSNNNSNNTNSSLYNAVTENNTQQREFGSGNNRNTGSLESTSNQRHQNEGVRTGDRIDSMVENVPGVPSSSTQNKPTFDTPSYQNDMHHDTSSHTPIDAARAPPSALKQHLGEPKIEHDYPHESSTKRHSSVSHQEEHYNLS